MSIPYDSQATTPGRDLRVLFDVDETVCVSPGFEIPLQAADIAPAGQAGNGTSVKVQLSGGDPQAWELRNVQADAEQSHEWIPGAGIYYRWDDVLVPIIGATGKDLIDEGPLFLSPFESMGMVVGVNGEPVQSSGDWFLIKKIVASLLPGLAQLNGDALQFPGPDPPTQNVPMDRVVQGKTLDPRNCGYHLRFLCPTVGGGVPDNVMTFFFGGDTLGENRRGAYCVTFRGTGAAILYEMLHEPIASPHGVSNWRQVWVFRYAAPNAVADTWHTINIRPHAGGGIRFEVASTDVADRNAGPDIQGGPHFSLRPPNPHMAQFVADATISGPLPAKYTTGEGVIRVDVRRDILLWFQISRSAFPVLPDYGLVEDQPRAFPMPIANDALTASAPSIWLQMEADIPDGTTLVPTLYATNDDGTDGAALSGSAFSPTLYRFDAIAGVQLYRAEYKLTTLNQFDSPRLFFATLYKEPVYDDAAGLNVWIRPSIQGTDGGGASVTGTDRDPRHESASAFISDLNGEMILLRRRARIRSKIQVWYNEALEAKKGSGDQGAICNLFEGEASHIEGQLLGFAGESYPSPAWRDFEATFCGLWARGEDTYNFYRAVFNSKAEIDPNTGLTLPPQITDVATNVLYNTCGVPLEEIDIPDADVPFLPSADVGTADFMLAPRSRPWDFVLKLFHDYLGWVFFRDHNAGPIGRDGSPRGMWRARPDADLFGGGEPLWSFVFGQDEGAGPAHDRMSYPPQTTFIQRHTYKDWVEPPEANAIYVIAPNDSSKFSGGAGRFKNTAVLYNLDSFNGVPGQITASDRFHPDFLGRMVPFILMDPGLGMVPDEPGQPAGSGVQAACNRLCYYLYQRIAHARKRFRFRAPLELVKDPTDPLLLVRRPLRMNDPVLVNGFPAILKSVDFDGPLQTSRQWGLVQGVFVGTGNQIPM